MRGKRWQRDGLSRPWYRRRLFIVGVVIILILTAGVGYSLSQEDKPKPQPNRVAVAEPETEIESVSGRYLMNGTIFWGRAIEKWSAKTGGGYDYARPFSGLNTFGREQYDAWVADLECPVMDIVIPYATQINNLQFNCRPEYLAEAVKYFDIIDLANNHSGDQGEDGFEETRQNVLKAGMQVYGNYDPGVKEDRCEVMALPVRLQQSDDQETKASMPVAFCAYHYFGRMPRAGELEYMKQYTTTMPVFAFIHMGTEYLTEANPFQVEVAHAAVDQGVDFVVLNNPHWVQNTEVYKDTLIMYSTGNFIFDQIDSEGMRSVSLDVTMKLNYDDNLAKWLQLGDSCKAFQDDCFTKAKTQKLKKPEVDYTFGVVAGDNSGKLTKKAGPAIQKAVEERTNWADTLLQLKQTD